MAQNDATPLTLDRDEVDSALLKVHNADTTPTQGSSQMVTSGGVEAITSDHETRISSLEAVTVPVGSAIVFQISKGTEFNSSGNMTGWSTFGDSNVASVSGGTITINGQGKFLVDFETNVIIYNDNKVSYRKNGSEEYFSQSDIGFKLEGINGDTFEAYIPSVSFLFVEVLHLSITITKISD